VCTNWVAWVSSEGWAGRDTFKPKAVSTHGMRMACSGLDWGRGGGVDLEVEGVLSTRPAVGAEEDTPLAERRVVQRSNGSSRLVACTLM